VTQTYNIYCDESCHLENDHQNMRLTGKAELRKAETAPRDGFVTPSTRGR
jgi:hypothetical protein